MEKILIGTSGYDYPEWKGVFYPPEVKRADFLYYYATQFNAVELNNKFYNMPTAERLFSFYVRSEGKLQFSLKANRLLTHEIDTQWQIAADDFKTALSPLLEKGSLSAVLFQFPQSFHYTNDNRIYLAKMIAAFEGYPVVIEFRHKEWIRESVFEGLVQRKASVAFCDMPDLNYLPKMSLSPVATSICQVFLKILPPIFVFSFCLCILLYITSLYGALYFAFASSKKYLFIKSFQTCGMFGLHSSSSNNSISTRLPDFVTPQMPSCTDRWISIFCLGAPCAMNI